MTAKTSTGATIYATKDFIFGLDDLQIEELFVSEWNVTVRIRSLTGWERDAFEQSLVDQRGKKNKLDLSNARAKLVALCVVDDKNVRLFSDSDVTMLGTKSASALDKIYTKASEMSGISDKDMDELIGELKSDPKGSSTSG